MAIIKKTVIKNKGNSNSIYPRTSADMVNYNNSKTVKDELEYIDNQLDFIESKIQYETEILNNNNNS